LHNNSIKSINFISRLSKKTIGRTAKRVGQNIDEPGIIVVLKQPKTARFLIYSKKNFLPLSFDITIGGTI